MSSTVVSADAQPEISTVEFGLDGSTYEVDLSSPDAAAVREALASYVATARRNSTLASASTSQSEGWVKQVGELIDAQLHRLVQEDPAIVDTTPAEVAEKLVAGVPTRHDLDRLVGPFYDTAGLTRWLGVSRQALDDRTKKGTLLMCPLQDGTRVYPAWQFRSDTTPVPHLVETLKILHAGAESPWTVATWLRTPLKKFNDVDPVSWLDGGGEAEVVLTAARTDADRWSR